MENSIQISIEKLDKILSIIDESRKPIIIRMKQELNQAQGNLRILSQVMNFVDEKILNRIITLLEKIAAQESIKHNLIDLDFELKKLEMMIKFLPSILRTPDSVFFALPEQHPDLEVLQSHIKYEQIDTDEKINLALDNLSAMVSVGYAFANSGQGLDNFIYKMMRMNSKGLQYLMNKELARVHAVRLLTNPTIEHMQSSWGIIETNPVVKAWIRSMLDKIAVNLRIYIPRVFEPITLTNCNANPYLASLPASLMYDRMFAPIYHKTTPNEKIKIRLLTSQKHVVKEVVKGSDICQVINSIPNKNPQEKINFNAQYEQAQQGFGGFNFFTCCGPRHARRNPITKVVIHFHGGGFVAMSSFSHQTYTRKWANYLGEDAVVFSVDYRLAPEHPFPAGLDDCWQAYLWIVMFSQCFFNIKPEQIVLVGDSAGGNLVMGVTIRAIQHNIRIPDALFLIYPAMILDLHTYFPSLLNTLSDRILPFSILELCMQSYLSSGIDPRHIYVSPGFCKDPAIIQKYPEKIEIISGSQDCLKDQCIDFVNLLIKYQKHPNLTIFKCFPHGFMNYAFPKFGLLQATPVIQSTCEMLKKLFH